MKRVIKKIRAFFKFKGEEKVMDLESAEIKSGVVFLHAENDRDHTFCIKSDSVDICINPLRELTEDDIWVIDNESKRKVRSKKSEEAGVKNRSGKAGADEDKFRLNGVADWPQYRKKQVSFYLYEDEYDLLLAHLEENGYKKAEFFYACIQSTKKNSMNAVYKQIEEDHKNRRRESRKAVRTH